MKFIKYAIMTISCVMILTSVGYWLLKIHWTLALFIIGLIIGNVVSELDK